MLGKMLKGAAWCATFGLATVGALTFVPDDAWESFPAGLSGARSKLAEFGVAPSRYRETADSDADSTGSDESSFVANGDDAVLGLRVRVGGKRAARASRFGEAGGVGTLDDATESLVSRKRDERNGSTSGTRRSPTSDLSIEQPGGREENVDDLATVALFGDGFASTEKNGFNDYFDPNDLVASSENVDDGANVSSADIVDRLADENFNAPEGKTADFNENNGNNEIGGFNGFVEKNGTNASIGTEPLTLAPTNGPVAESFGESNAFSAVESASPLAPAQRTSGSNEVGTAPAPQTQAPFAVAPIAGNGVPSADGSGTAGGASQAFIPLDGGNAEEPVDARAQGAEPLTAQPAPAGGALDFESALDAAARRTSPESTRTAFQALSRTWREGRNALSTDDRTRLASELDRLAFDSFYNAAETPLEPLRVVAAGETLASIARETNATSDALAAINGFDVSQVGFDAPLQPGISLKTIRGPVSAEISLRDRELTLYFDGLYAGRFAFGTPKNALGLRGTFAVADKIVNPACNAIGADGSPVEIPGGSPDNPLGAGWISLTGEGGASAGLQGTNRPALIGRDVEENGGLLFSDREIAQLIVLLPIGAVVSVGE